MTADFETHVRLLSDGVLYDKAQAFAQQHGSFVEDEQGRKQANGLLRYGRDGIDELDKYAKKQASRDWSGRKAHYRSLYQSLSNELAELWKLVVDEGLVPQNLVKKQLQAATAEAASPLAREFIQHLVAEMLYRQGGG